MKRYVSAFRRFLYRDYIPITKGIVVLCVALFAARHLLLLFRLDLYSFLRLDSFRWLLRPWTLLTYPLVNSDLLSLIFGLLWVWYIGGSLERSWSGQTYGFFLGLATGVTGLAFILVSMVVGRVGMGAFQVSMVFARIGSAGLWLPLTGLTWAWAKHYPDRELLFWGLFPIKAQWLAWLQAALMFYRYFYNLGFALAAISSIAVVYLFSGRGPFAHGLRYWAWTHNFPGKGWQEKMRDKWRKRKFKVVK
jgi:membrane associated rhomboid family serine protease